MLKDISSCPLPESENKKCEYYMRKYLEEHLQKDFQRVN